MMRCQVFVDRGERITKCTILPLAGHPAMDIVRYHRGRPLGLLSGQLLLHPDGESLATVRDDPGLGKVHTLSAIDCTWKRLQAVIKQVQEPLPRLVGIPAGFVTAYPRRNKLNQDPEGGLATIEALFIAAAFLGHWDESLLGCYPFAQAFLTANRDTFAHYQVAGVETISQAKQSASSGLGTAVNEAAFQL